ncbi:MAG: cytidylate kinase family protein [Candidatus Aenigmarchaeota archaeon]|nr:cytidylate kinase family protein [Candidatus Aenigmarchaeota archaeon]
MIITLSGEVGSGKSTIGKEIAKKLNYTYNSTGEIFKKLAEEHKIDLTDFLEYAEKNLDLDTEVDEKQRATKQNTILDSRMGFHFANSDLKIWLKAPLDERIKRIVKRDNLSLEIAKEKIEKREKIEREKYIRLYSVDIFDAENYDLIIDTVEYNIEQVVEKICAYLNI